MVEDYPLAFCDCSRVSPQDLIASDIINSDHGARSFNLGFRRCYLCCFLSSQNKHEVIFIKMYDFLPGVEAKCEFCNPGGVLMSA